MGCAQSTDDYGIAKSHFSPDRLPQFGEVPFMSEANKRFSSPLTPPRAGLDFSKSHDCRFAASPPDARTPPQAEEPREKRPSSSTSADISDCIDGARGETLVDAPLPDSATARPVQATVKGTWDSLKSAGMLDTFALRLYDEMLSHNPRLRVLFYAVDFDDQAELLAQMLAMVVHFSGKPEAARQALLHLGARHRAYGVQGDQFLELRRAFFVVFPKFVGEAVFAACEEEWEGFWDMVIEALVHGGRTSQGEKYAAARERELTRSLREDVTLLAERQSGLDWRQRFVAVLYDAAAATAEMDAFRGLLDPREGRRVFEAFVDFAMGVDERAGGALRRVLDTGADRVGAERAAALLPHLRDPFLAACRHFLRGEWNIVLESRFAGLWAAMRRRLDADADAGRAGSVCLVFADIDGGPRLWATRPLAMAAAVERYRRLVRGLIVRFGASEVKLVADSFTITCGGALSAAKLALALQLELMRHAPIAPGFALPAGGGRGEAACWRADTLRVRMGVELCPDAVSHYDVVNRRYDYDGPSVARAARIAASACGGQILLSMETMESLRADAAFCAEPCPAELRDIVPPAEQTGTEGLDQFVSVQDLGKVQLRYINEPVRLFSMTPWCLRGRQFADRGTRDEM